MKVTGQAIQQKLINVIMITSSAVTLLICIAFFAYEIFTFRQATLQGLETLGQIISSNSTAALAFDDPKAATEILAALKAESHIEVAGLYDNSNNLFSTYPADLPRNSLPLAPGPKGYRFEDGHVAGVQPVMQGDQLLGNLYVRSNIEILYERFKLYAVGAFLILFGGFVISYVLSKGLQQRISKPILSLAETARIVSKHQDYSVRAKKISDDEVGLLTDAFNQMLARIEKQTLDISESEERMRSVLNSAMMAVIVMDRSGKIIDWNLRAEAIFGWAKEEVSGKDLADTLIPPNLRARHKAGIQHYLSNGKTNIFNRLLEITALHRDGKEFPIELSISPLKTNEVLSFCVFITDITERKQNEEKIKLFNQELEQRVQERTKELEIVNKELESFSYSVSHDLRAPLRAIHGYMNILTDEYAGKFDAESLRLTAIIMSNTQKMGRLIDDLLAFSQLGRKELIKTQTSMSQMVTNICEEQKRMESSRQIEFIVRELPDALVDTVTMRQVWVNLISNSVKYTRNRDRAVIEIGSDKREDEQIYFIKDNGAGFDMLYYDKLFGVFQRLHSQKEFEGTGVGLAIVQRIITRHGGKVWAEGKFNEGATFYFTLKK